MKRSLLVRIREEYPRLSKSHKRIADYILKNYEKAAFYTAAKLGEVTGISVSTVVRFATQMGYPGYPEFQDALRETIKGKLTSQQRMEVASQQFQDSESILDSMLHKDTHMIKETLEQVSREDFEKASEAINRANAIYIVGVRSSAPLASFMNFYLRMVYDNVRVITSNSSSEMLEEIFHIKRGDICIAISFPRYSKQVVKALNYVHEKGGEIIAITDNERSPIARVSDYNLVAKSSMASYIDSLVAPLSLINALILSASVKKQGDVIETFNELERIWGEYGVYENLEDDKNR